MWKINGAFQDTKITPDTACTPVERDARRKNEEIAVLWIVGITKPGIRATWSFTVDSQVPHLRHWNAVMKDLAYLKGGGDMGLTFAFANARFTRG